MHWQYLDPEIAHWGLLWTVRHNRTALRLSPSVPRHIMLRCINNGITVTVVLLILRFCAHMMLCFGFMTRTLFGQLLSSS